MTNILMPKLSDTMTEGILGAWLKSVGDRVVRGEIIAEVETDKATMELEAFASGTLLEQRVVSGQTVAVGTVIGVIGEQTEVATLEKALPTPALPPAKTEAAPAPQTEDPEPKEPIVTKTPSEEHREERSAPVVRRQAQELGIELGAVQGSGPGGRVLLEDLEQFVKKQAEDAPPRTSSKQSMKPQKKDESLSGVGIPPLQADETRPQSRMRTAIAHTVSESWRSIPHFFITSEIRMDKVKDIRHDLKTSGITVSLNDLMIKAAALSLQKYPLINSSLNEENVTVHREVNIGIMVSVPDGLLVPVIKGCQSLSIKEIAEKSRQLIESSRNGTINETEIRGGTFSISNLGMYGINRFSAVILPKQVAILAVGGDRDAVVVTKGKPEVARIMEVTLSADHRVLDGVYAAQFLGEFKRVIESPVQLLL